MVSPCDAGALQRLETAVISAQDLCHQLATSLDDIYKNPSAALDQNTNNTDIKLPLDLARDATTLVRAHSTKLSLLLINEPFTPSAIADVLKQLISGPVLGLASAAQACDPAQYTAFFRKELAWRARRILVTLSELLGKIPKKDGVVLSGAKKSGFAADNKGSLPATGILWSACDEMLVLISGGIKNYFITKVDQWKETLEDIMEELKEWGDEQPDDDGEEDDDDDDDDDDNGGNDDINQETDTTILNSSVSTQDMLDHLMSSGPPIPRDDPRGIRPRLDSTLRRVRLVVLLYQAISKRRLKQLPPLPPPPDSTYTNMPRRLDEAVRVLSALPESFGDLVSVFYDMEPAVIDRAADDCFFEAFAAGELLSDPWYGGQDEFSEWTEKFKTEIKRS
ncbi:hypothetical protein BBAD15_g11186 [Beauveria bassiana D1-5]|uniref:Cyclin-D1-binding protein 1-like N-terminal domain-containing protein n=1 Tax=Beauveria bassiana D1-5 TaxID=1245745 RepID=A0A0A2VB57_BEABA|nr:hypothetical protein BBAD15_g11186 [Beauveria bassiana D1-5]